jgi:predicted acetyltransferase
MADRIEAGQARPDELEPILEIMCESFEMPYKAARAIYYADPYLDHRKKRVVRVNGEVVSCLTIVDASCRIGQTNIRLGGIAGVATRHRHRRRGYAGLLLEETLGALAAQGVALAALFPFSRDYYRRMGWETCGVIWRCQLQGGALPRFASRFTLRKAVSSDIPALDRIYAAQWKNCNLACLRDEQRWRYILDHTTHPLACQDANGEIGGYLLHGYRHGEVDLLSQGGAPPLLRILEMASEQDEARRAILDYLAAHCPAGGIEYHASWRDLERSGLLDYADDGDRVQLQRLPGIMARLLDFPVLASHLRASWQGFRGRIEIVMRDPDTGAAPQTLRIVGDGRGTPEIEVGPNALASTQRIVGDVRVWTQVVVGALAVGDAAAMGGLQATNDEALQLASTLFPRNMPFLPTPDHF